MQKEVEKLNQIIQKNDILSCMEISFQSDSDSILIFVKNIKCGQISKKRCIEETDIELFKSLRQILGMGILDELWRWNDLLETTKYLGCSDIK